jgi:hypothetical protein
MRTTFFALPLFDTFAGIVAEQSVVARAARDFGVTTFVRSRAVDALSRTVASSFGALFAVDVVFAGGTVVLDLTLVVLDTVSEVAADITVVADACRPAFKTAVILIRADSLGATPALFA